MNTQTHPAARSSRASTRAVRPRRRRFMAALMGAGLLLVAVLALQGAFHHAVKEITLPLHHEDIIRQQAAEKDLDPALIAAVIYAESRFVPGRTSSAGAEGLMQITPATAADIARRSGGTAFVTSDLATPQVNISYGSYLLSELLHRYDGNEVAALAAYNAGPGNADRWGGSGLTVNDIPFAETRAYVAKVLDARGRYRKTYRRELGL